MVPSAEATEQVASLFPLEHSSKKARATLIYIRMSSVKKRSHAIMLRHVRAKHSTKYISNFIPRDNVISRVSRHKSKFNQRKGKGKPSSCFDE
jgi:hypothetical protein